MILFKKLLLKARLAFGSSKVQKEVNQPVNYEQAEKIGVLIFLNDPSLLNNVEEFAKSFMREGKKVEGLCFSYGPNPIRFTFPCQYFSFQDLDWMGEFKGETVNKFIKTPFDYLYSINILPILPFKFILRKSKAKCRVGMFEEKTDLDFMIQTPQNKGLNFLLEQMKFYSKKISS